LGGRLQRFLRESRAKVWANTHLLDTARRAGPDAYAARLAELERRSAARVADLTAPGQVVLNWPSRASTSASRPPEPAVGGVDGREKSTSACATHALMLLRMRTRMIQIRHVPEDVHRRLTERAKREGMSLSDYLRRELTDLSHQLSWEELFEQMDRDPWRSEGLSDVDAAELIRQGREERDRELTERLGGDQPEP
jgi:hypothetical protein